MFLEIYCITLVNGFSFEVIILDYKNFLINNVDRKFSNESFIKRALLKLEFLKNLCTVTEIYCI